MDGAVDAAAAQKGGRGGIDDVSRAEMSDITEVEGEEVVERLGGRVGGIAGGRRERNEMRGRWVSVEVGQSWERRKGAGGRHRDDHGAVI